MKPFPTPQPQDADFHVVRVYIEQNSMIFQRLHLFVDVESRTSAQTTVTGIWNVENISLPSAT